MPAWATAAGLALIIAVSLWIRTRVLGAGFWIDEGLSVGIAHHSLSSIPDLLRQDGSPPLYYLLLHVWIGAFGDGERATHMLSLLFALACIPLAYWAGRSIFGPLTGWICAGLAAVDPYLTYYGQETRMYAMVAALSFVAAVAYVHGVLDGRRRYLPVLGVALVLILYTHNWGLFLVRRLRGRHASVRTRQAEGGSDRRRDHPHPLPALAPHAAFPEQAHRRALGDNAEPPCSAAGARAPCSPATRRSRRSCWPAASGSRPPCAAARIPPAGPFSRWPRLSARPCSLPGSRPRSRRRGQPATSGSCWGRCS